MGLQLTRRRRILFAFAAIAIAAAVTMALLIALDVYLHRKFERSAGFNVWGYRGPVAARKQPGEYRVVMLGGSTAYGELSKMSRPGPSAPLPVCIGVPGR